ncbi:arsenate reductase family protein [Sulfurimonas sp.]
MVKIYGIKNCDSVKKALKFFKEHNIAYELHDFKETPVGCNTVERWLEHTNIKTLFNARSTTYRNLELKKMNLDENAQKEWLCKENLLIKRPVIEYQSEIMVGFNEQNYTRSFL